MAPPGSTTPLGRFCWREAVRYSFGRSFGLVPGGLIGKKTAVKPTSLVFQPDDEQLTGRSPSSPSSQRHPQQPLHRVVQQRPGARTSRLGTEAGLPAPRERRIIGVQSRNLCGVYRERAYIMKTTCGANVPRAAREGGARLSRPAPPSSPNSSRRATPPPLITRWLFRRGKRRETCSAAYPISTSG